MRLKPDTPGVDVMGVKSGSLLRPAACRTPIHHHRAPWVAPDTFLERAPAFLLRLEAMNDGLRPPRFEFIHRAADVGTDIEDDGGAIRYQKL